VDGLIKLLDYQTKFDVFNIGTSDPQPIKLWIELIEKTFDTQAKYKVVEVDKGDVVSSADISKATRLLDYKPKMNIEEGIRRQVEIFNLMPKWFKTMEKV
jgi:UDP-glucuronate 4-epimerase